MKELTIEEKARRYDGAIKRLEDIETGNCQKTFMFTEGLFDYIFPELKESEDERIRKALINGFNKLDKSAVWYNGITNGQILAWLEKQAQKPNPCDGCINRKGCINCENGELRETEQKPWSEEDEVKLKSACALIRNTSLNGNESIVDSTIIFLKSLKDRVQPQLKQEWKQENMDDLTDFENTMMHIGDSFFGQHAGLDPNDTNAIKEQANLLLGLVPKQEWSEEDEKHIMAIDLEVSRCIGKWNCCGEKCPISEHNHWLKSLKERYTWKPSDEQMEVLENVRKILQTNDIYSKSNHLMYNFE